VFQTLLESRATVTRGRSRWTVVSAAVHATLITAATAATMNSGRIEPRDEPVDVIYVAPSLPRVSRTDASTRTSMFSVPTDVTVPTIPIVGRIDSSPTHIDASIGAEISGSSPLAGSPSDGVFTELTVDRIVAPLAANPQPTYPRVLRSSGLAGTVMARFVVDTNGSVERTSIAILESTHAAFADAVRAWLPLTRYYPAEAGGHRVRQLVQQRVEFQLR
jgi:protein TonB